jgi:DNA-binding GntR family transcriptional regulator
MDDQALGSGQADQVFSGRHDRRKVTDWVCEEIREAIIDLRLRPGEPLREAGIASQLGVSKTPIREALARLEQEGLVETTSFKGAVVSGYSPRDLEEIYELRGLLEGAAVRAVALDPSEEARAQLGEVIARSRELRDAGELTELAGLLGHFDQIIYNQVTNRRIRALIDNLRAHLTRIGKLTEGIPGRVEASVEEHAVIVEAIMARRSHEAEQLMRAHIESVLGDQLAGTPAAATADEVGA